MRIIKCNITNFGCYSNKVFDFNSSLNSFCIDNGEGKTTLATFIKAMLYSLDKTSVKSYERIHYKPYQGGIYGGSMTIEIDNKKYTIERTFNEKSSKDTLKIYDENGNDLKTFLNKEVSLLQGDNSSFLGELILGIDSLSFKKCNFISSNDLDFSSTESIKMKINSIVINKEKENSFDETCKLIDFDLKEKKPSSKNNENAYPFKIKELNKINKEKKKEIEELNKIEDNLKNLYDERKLINDDLNKIKEEQKKYDLLHIKKGKLSTVKKYDEDILKEEDNIKKIENKYNDDLLNNEEINILKDYLSNYNKLKTIDNTFKIKPSDINKLESLKDKVISNEDYNILNENNIKINSLNLNNKCIFINEKRFNELKNKFENKSIKDEKILTNEYIEYLTNKKELESLSYLNNKTNEYPSNNIINHIEEKIKKYNELNNKINNLNSSYKEPQFIIKLLLSIFTLGIYFIILNNKKKKYLNNLKILEDEIKDIQNELNEFFNKYDIEFGSYEIKLQELIDKIEKDNNTCNLKNNELNKKSKELENNLKSYFSLFDYSTLDIKDTYELYKKELNEYNSLIKDDIKNKEIENNNKTQKEKHFKIIDSILLKYKLLKNDDFSSQLLKLKEDMDFFNKYYPIYIDKASNDNKINDCSSKITSILNNHNINFDNDYILISNNLIKDLESYNKSKNNLNSLIEEKNKFIKENDLIGFNEIEVNDKEEELQKEYSLKSSLISNKDREIIQNEEKILQKEKLQDEINTNEELIKEYEKKIEIAKITLETLKAANNEMEAKYISPIKDSFINYSKKIYEKIGTNINMNYDYEIKYDVNGQLHESKDLSEGEKSIMMLALRFSILDSLFKDKNSFIILDDPFEALDSNKLFKAINLIKELSKKYQIIYFTCHNSRKIDSNLND